MERDKLKSVECCTSPRTCSVRTSTETDQDNYLSDSSCSVDRSLDSSSSSCRTPMSERQQLALLRQMTSPVCPSRLDWSGVFGVSSTSRSPISTRPIASSHNKRNRRGETKLHVAAIRGDLQRVQSLLSDGAEVNATDFAGWTPLHEACVHGWVGVVRALLAAGASVSAVGPDAVTPLHDAVTVGCHRVVRLLLKHGADRSACTLSGQRTPADLCTCPRILRLLNPTHPSANLSAGDNKENDRSSATSCRSSLVDRIDRHLFDMESPTDQRSEQPASVRPCDKPASESVVPQSTSVSGDPGADDVSIAAKSSVSTEELFIDSGSSDSTVGGKRCHDRSDDADQEETGRKRRRPRDDTGTGKHAGRNFKSFPMSSGLEKTKVSSAATTATTKLSSECQKPVSKGSMVVSAGSPVGSPVRTRGPGTGLAQSEDSDDNESRPKVPPLKIVINSSASDGTSGAVNFGAGCSDVDCGGCTGSSGRLPYVVASQEAGSSECGTISEESGNKSTTFMNSVVSVSDPHSSTEDAPSAQNNAAFDLNSRVTRSYRSTAESYTSESVNVAGEPSISYSSEQQSCHDTSGQRQMSDVESAESSAPSQGEDMVQLSSCHSPDLTAQSSLGQSAHSVVPLGVDSSNIIGVVEHPRKRRFRQARAANNRQHEQSSTGHLARDPPCSSAEADSLQASFTNNYKMYSEIRRQVERRRRELFPISPKPPRGYRDYLLNRRSYVLYGNRHSRLSMPSAAAPSSLDPTMKQLYTEQEMERYKLRLQHIIEKEKLVLAVEQEILRVHGRAARALANQSLPFGACSMLKHEEVYTLTTPEQEEKERNVRHRYNGRQFCSWLQDVEDKWEKIRENMILRQHSEAEALYAIQMMDWTGRIRETGNVSDQPPVVAQQHVPMVQVIDDFDIPST